MANEQLRGYVEQSLAQGMKPEEVRAALASQGWTGADIDQALGAPAVRVAAAPPVVTEGRPKWPIALGVALILLVLAGGAFAYFRFFRVTPDQRVARAVNAAIAAKSVEYEASLRVEAVYKQGASTNPALALLSATNAPEQPVKLLVTADGAYDRLDAARPKSRSSFTVATTQALGGAPLGTLEMRQVDDATYLSLTQVPKIPLVDLSPLAGVWVKYDPQALAGLISSATSAPKTRKEGPTKEQGDAIEKAFMELRPAYVVETLKDEDVDGVASLHYRLAIDKAKLRAFLLKVQEIMDDKASLAYEKLSDDYDKFSKDLAIESLEIWIGKADGLPTRLFLRANAKESEDFPGEGTFTFDMTFKNFGKPIQIEAPAGAKSIEEVFGMLMSGSGSRDEDLTLDAVERRDAAEIISDIRQVQTALELAYSEMNAYPISTRLVLGGPDSSVLCKAGTVSAWKADEEDCDGSVYMKSIPSSPILGTDYEYESADGTRYALRFSLPTAVGQYAAGPLCATQDGIFTGATCLPADDDNDGLNESDERMYGTDPTKADTDGDGFNDGDEVKNGYNPNGPGTFR